MFSTSTLATTYYVSSNGNDTHSGISIASAWATINRVNSHVFLPGDTLYFEGGQTFNGNIFLSDLEANDPGNIFVISSFGTGRATINAGTSYGFFALNTQGFSINNLIFDGNTVSTNTNAGITILADVSGDVKFSNISISNIEVRNFGAEGIKIYSTHNLTGFQNVDLSNLSVHDVTKNGIEIFGFVSQTLTGWAHKNISVSNCEVYHVPGSLVTSALEGNGIVLSGVDGGMIQHCVAHDNGQNNSRCGGPVGIWSLESNKVTIQFCESYRNHNGTGCDGAGFDLDGGMTNSMMQYNYSHDNDGSGYLLGQYENARPWSNNTVRYNIGENDGVLNEGGMGLFKGPGTTMSGANIYNNTIYVSQQPANNNESAVYFTNWTTGIDNVSFFNNIFITAGNLHFINIPSGYSAFFAGNIYWSAGSTFSIQYQGNHYSTLDSWRTATGNEIVSGSNTGFNSDPLLTNTGSGGTIGFGNSLTSLNAYKIQDISSPAYHTALDLSSLFSINTGTTDFWGTTLTGGNSNDIGSNQFGSGSTLPIVLLAFYGNCSGSENNIFWVTAEETNMKSINLMYSGDRHKFIGLADIMPKGSNSSYKYINGTALPGNNYYQLKMTDLDGAVTYSPVLNIECERVSDKISIWPNPFSHSVQISIESITSGSATIALYDALGKLQLQKEIQFQEGSNLISLDGQERFPPGTYFLQIVHQGQTEHFKLLKTGN